MKRDRLYKQKWWLTALMLILTVTLDWLLLNLAFNYVILVFLNVIQTVKDSSKAVSLAFQWRYLVQPPKGLYWYTTIPLAFIVTMLYGYKLSVRIQQRLFPSSTAEGSNRWATSREIRRQLTALPRSALTDAKPLNKRADGGVLIAMDGHNCYVDRDDVHAIVFGAARSGKTQYAILTTMRLLIMDRRSMIVNDVKGELLENTYAQLQASGYLVRVLNLREPHKSNGWHMFGEIIRSYVHDRQTDGDLSATADLIGELSAYITENRQSDPIWPTSAKALLDAMIKYLLEDAYGRKCLDRLNLYSVYVFFIEYGEKTLMKGKKEANALDELLAALPPGHWAKMSYATSKFAQGDMRASIFGTLSSNLELFADEGIARMTSTDEIRFEDLYSADRPCAIFMIIPDEKPNRHRLASLFIAQSYSALISAAYRYPRQRLPRRVTYVLDEFGLLPRISDMDVKINGCLSRGVSFYLCVQGISQLDDKYGKASKSILASCHDKIYILSQEPETTGYIQKLLNKETVEVETHGGTNGDLLDTRRSTHIKSRELMTADELGRLEKGEVIVIRQRSYPIRTHLVPYYQLRIPTTPLSDIPSGKTAASIADILYPFDQAKKVDHKKQKDAAEPEQQSVKPKDTPQARRAIINACNLKTQMRFEKALAAGDTAAVGEMAERLLEDGDIAENEYEIISNIVNELSEKK